MSKKFDVETPSVPEDFEDVAAAIQKIPARRRPVAKAAVGVLGRRYEAKPSETKIFNVLLDSLHWKSGQTYPIGRSDLEAATQYYRSTITRALKVLSDNGFILSKQHMLNGRHQRNTYTFPHLAEFFDSTQELQARLRAGKRLPARKRLIVPVEWLLKDKQESP